MPVQHLYLHVKTFKGISKLVCLKLNSGISRNTRKTHTICPNSWVSSGIWYFVNGTIIQAGRLMRGLSQHLPPPPFHPTYPKISNFSYFHLSYIYWIITWRTVTVFPGESHVSTVDFLWTINIPLLLQEIKFWDCGWSTIYLILSNTIYVMVCNYTLLWVINLMYSSFTKLLALVVQKLCLFSISPEPGTVPAWRKCSESMLDERMGEIRQYGVKYCCWYNSSLSTCHKYW